MRRTFVFFHHEPFGPFTLADLHGGNARYGGSVARLRILFALARRGHEVWLAGNVTPGEHGAVKAVAAQSARQALDAIGSSAPVLVYNNPPSEAEWSDACAGRRVRRVVWAGNPFEQRWMDRLVGGDLDRIVCVSRWHRDTYRVYDGFEKLEVSYSGIDRDLLTERRPVEAGLVLSLSVPRSSKGFDRLLAAWLSVRAEHPSARLVVSGAARMHHPDAVLGRTGILDAEVEDRFPQIFGQGTTSMAGWGVELLGAVALGDVYATLAKAAVAVVNPSHNSVETYCRAAVEAQAMGVPVVGARAGALPEVIADGRTGLLTRTPDPQALASAIGRLLGDSELAASMSEAGPPWSHWMSDYDLIAPDWERIAERADTGEPAPCEPHSLEDGLRRLGYGRFRSRLKSLMPSQLRAAASSARARLS